MKAEKIEKNEPITNKIYELLRESILAGEIPEGDWLNESDYASAFGVSRTPVRAALRTLEGRGLLRKDESGRYVVKEISEEEVYEMYLVRSALEGLAAELACKSMSDNAIVQLEKHLSVNEEAYRNGETSVISFHILVAQSSGIDLLENLITDFKRRCSVFERRFIGDDQEQASLSEHREILDAMKRKDCEKARQLMSDHIMKIVERRAVVPRHAER